MSVHCRNQIPSSEILATNMIRIAFRHQWNERVSGFFRLDHSEVGAGQQTARIKWISTHIQGLKDSGILE